MPAHESWHISRSFSSTHREDACSCPQEPCGFVARDKVDPTCQDHGLSMGRTIRRSHRPDACPGATTPVTIMTPAGAEITAIAVDEPDWERIYDEDEAWLQANADALAESLKQLRNGDVLPALTSAEMRVRAARHSLASFVPTPVDGTVHAAFAVTMDDFHDAVIRLALTQIRRQIEAQEWSDLYTEGLETAYGAVTALLTTTGDDDDGT